MATVEGINIKALSTQEHYALDILENLTSEQLHQIKQLLELNEPDIISSTTLKKFLQLCQELDFDLSEAGVNAFKNQHKLGNTGAVQGIIGAQTAGIYYEQIIAKTSSNSSTSNSHNGREINQAGLHLIEEFEGLARKLSDGRIAAYSDAVGIPTIGYGHTHGVHLGQIITPEQAQEFLQQDLRQAESAVSSLVKVNLNDNQFAALVSFVFNLGSGAFSRSTLLRDLNAKNYQAAADQFLSWTHAGGKVLPGLVRRRQAERKLFLS